MKLSFDAIEDFKKKFTVKITVTMYKFLSSKALLNIYWGKTDIKERASLKNAKQELYK